MARLTTEQLKALQDLEDWQSLWVAAIPWVKFAAMSLRTGDREDLIQDGLLEAGRQLKNWDSTRGQFSTFINNVARNAMLKHIKRKDRRHEVTRAIFEGLSKDSVDCETTVVYPDPTYRDTPHTPEGFGDPAEEIGRAHVRAAAERLLQELDAGKSLMLREYFGLPVLDSHDDAQTASEMGAARGVPRQTMEYRIRTAQKHFGEAMKAGYMPSTVSIYPQGQESRRTTITADERWPGFWNIGLASAMGDVDVWRESVGTVWNDWSWKPTAADIARGAKK